MKNFKVLFVLILSLVLTACWPYNETVEEYSSVLEEDAVVADLVYAPSHHNSDLEIGITTGGDLSLTPTSIDIPEKYAIVFKCQHGKFIIQCNTLERKKLWNDLDEDQKVRVKYKEVWLVEYRIEKKTKTPIARTLKDYWFLTAIPIR